MCEDCITVNAQECKPRECTRCPVNGFNPTIVVRSMTSEIGLVELLKKAGYPEKAIDYYLKKLMLE